MEDPPVAGQDYWLADEYTGRREDPTPMTKHNWALIVLAVGLIVLLVVLKVSGALR